MPTVRESFVDRRNACNRVPSYAQERRQFANSHVGLSSEAQELASAIDSYKLRHRRRYVDYEEMLAVITSLGYRKAGEPAL